MILVKVSAKCARLRFQGCEPDYIKNVCHGRCCHLPSHPQGTTLRVEPDQQPALLARGAIIIDHIVQTINKRCIFHDGPTGFCQLHNTPDKPRNCIQSPFMLTKKNTLIVRNRYKQLICFKAAPAIPAYQAFRASLDLLFGLTEAARICAHLDAGGGDIMAEMPEARYEFLTEVRHGWGLDARREPRRRAGETG